MQIYANTAIAPNVFLQHRINCRSAYSLSSISSPEQLLQIRLENAGPLALSFGADTAERSNTAK